MIKRYTPLPKRSTPIRKVSKGQAAKNKVYSKYRKTVFADPHDQECNITWDDGCTYFACDLHHVSRRGENLLKDGIKACRYCHDKVEQNPKEAMARGLLKSKY